MFSSPRRVSCSLLPTKVFWEFSGCEVGAGNLDSITGSAQVLRGYVEWPSNGPELYGFSIRSPLRSVEQHATRATWRKEPHESLEAAETHKQTVLPRCNDHVKRWAIRGCLYECLSQPDDLRDDRLHRLRAILIRGPARIKERPAGGRVIFHLPPQHRSKQSHSFYDRQPTSLDTSSRASLRLPSLPRSPTFGGVFACFHRGLHRLLDPRLQLLHPFDLSSTSLRPHPSGSKPVGHLPRKLRRSTPPLRPARIALGERHELCPCS